MGISKYLAAAAAATLAVSPVMAETTNPAAGLSLSKAAGARIGSSSSSSKKDNLLGGGLIIAVVATVAVIVGVVVVADDSSSN